MMIVKTDRKRHDWQVTSGYDRAQDGPNLRWRRTGIRCTICGEERRVRHDRPLTHPAIAAGCVRRSLRNRYRYGDILQRRGDPAIYRFVTYRPAGMAEIHGGQLLTVPVVELEPYL